MKKSDDLGVTHLEWLIQSRMRNQNACPRPFKIFEKYPDQAKGKDFRAASQTLVAVGFSLWRGAFLEWLWPWPLYELELSAKTVNVDELVGERARSNPW